MSEAFDYLEAADLLRKERRENGLCVLCDHPIGQHSATWGCIAKDEEGDCECEVRQ